MNTTEIHNYYTEIELIENCYTLVAEVKVEYTINECSDEHPYGNSTATHYYSELGDDIEVEIISWHRVFDCSDELSVWIPENLVSYEGEQGLSREDIKRITRLAECALEESL